MVYGISDTNAERNVMGTNKIPDILPVARRGSKRDWKAVTGELPPTEHERFVGFVRRDGRRRTDIVAEAVIEYLDRRAA